MPSYVTPRKNIAYKFDVGLVDQANTKLLRVNPTIAAGDFKVSTDHSAFANLATLPSVNPAGGRSVMIDLSASEMNGDNVVVQCIDAAGAEWCDLLVDIQTTASQIDDLATGATVAAIKAKTDFIIAGFQKNVAFPGFHIYMVNTANKGVEGLAVAGFRLRTGDTLFANLDNLVTELDAGIYNVDLTANDLNGDVVTLGFTAVGAVDREITLVMKNT